MSRKVGGSWEPRGTQLVHKKWGPQYCSSKALGSVSNRNEPGNGFPPKLPSTQPGPRHDMRVVVPRVEDPPVQAAVCPYNAGWVWSCCKRGDFLDGSSSCLWAPVSLLRRKQCILIYCHCFSSWIGTWIGEMGGGLEPGSPSVLPLFRQLWNEDQNPTVRGKMLHSEINFATCQVFCPEWVT